MSGKASRYPRHVAEFSDLESLLEKSVIADYLPREKIIDTKTIVRTQGSCFAANLAEALGRCNVQVRYTQVLEAVNSPLLNRILLERAISPEPLSDTKDDLAFARHVAEPLRRKIPTENVFILTLGLAYNWFNKETGAPCPIFDAAEIDKYEQRLSGVAENHGHIKKIVECIRILNPTMKIVLTVSPVPLKVDTTRESAIVGDFLSKATLRLATEEYLKEAPPDVYYWPAFEIVRWLGAHLGPVFGADDGMPRHVNRDLVNLIVRLFLRHFATPEAGLPL